MATEVEDNEPIFITGEILYPNQLAGRLSQLGAQPMPDRSSSTMHVYWLPSRNQWLGVQRKDGVMKLGYFTACPCAGGVIP